MVPFFKTAFILFSINLQPYIAMNSTIYEFQDTYDFGGYCLSYYTQYNLHTGLDLTHKIEDDQYKLFEMHLHSTYNEGKGDHKLIKKLWNSKFVNSKLCTGWGYMWLKEDLFISFISKIFRDTPNLTQEERVKWLNTLIEIMLDRFNVLSWQIFFQKFVDILKKGVDDKLISILLCDFYMNIEPAMVKLLDEIPIRKEYRGGHLSRSVIALKNAGW